MVPGSRVGPTPAPPTPPAAAGAAVRDHRATGTAPRRTPRAEASGLFGGAGCSCPPEAVGTEEGVRVMAWLGSGSLPPGGPVGPVERTPEGGLPGGGWGAVRDSCRHGPVLVAAG